VLATKFVDFGSLSHWRSKQEGAITAVNGCFDVIHAGHVRLLHFAAYHGTLIIGINSDEAVKRLKGSSRPINTQTNRAAVIAAFGFVDAVTIFDDSTATEFLNRIRPNFWIKGGDYSLDTINQQERMAVEDNGGRIRFFSLVEGLSSTSVISRLS
jgi:rfaE bifunctional protein nucleotidyltransferase chain/domain